MYSTAQSITEGIDRTGGRVKTDHSEPLPPLTGEGEVLICLITLAHSDTTLTVARAHETAGEAIELPRASLDYYAMNSAAAWVPRGGRFFQQEFWRVPAAVYAQVREAFNRGI